MQFNVTLFDKLSLWHRRREANLEEWHTWFAWYPVDVLNHNYRWLEKVGRRRVTKSSLIGPYTVWEYLVSPY